MAKWKTYTIIDVDKEGYSPSINFEIDGWLTFSDSDARTFLAPNESPFNGWKVGTNIEIDAEWAKARSTGTRFHTASARKFDPLSRLVCSISSPASRKEMTDDVLEALTRVAGKYGDEVGAEIRQNEINVYYRPKN